MTLADVSDVTWLSWNTVKGIVQKHLQHDYGQPRLKALKYLAVDEIYVGKRKQFYTLVLDLERGQIVWVGHGRGQAALGKFWRRLRLSRAKIQAVAMDMSGAYWAAVLEHLPGAVVVFDRFHIMKLMNEKLDELRRVLVREAVGTMRQTIKGTRYLLLTRAANLEKEKLPKLEDTLKLNQPLSQGLLPEGGTRPVMGTTFPRGDGGLPAPVVCPGDGNRHRPAAADGQDALAPRQRYSQLVGTPAQQRQNGRRQQQD